MGSHEQPGEPGEPQRVYEELEVLKQLAAERPLNPEGLALLAELPKPVAPLPRLTFRQALGQKLLHLFKSGQAPEGSNPPLLPDVPE